MSNTSSMNAKSIGIVAYLWIIGWIIALVYHNNNKTEFGAFHIRQALGLMILWFAVTLFNFILAVMDLGLFGWVLNVTLVIFGILGFIGAVQGEKKLIPAFGEQFQEWFKGIA